MSATSLDVLTLVFADPTLSSSETETFRILNSSISFDWTLNGGITTLSENSVTDGSQLDGLLYVPEIESSEACVEASSPYVPKNVTRMANLPEDGVFDVIGIAPWLSPQCTLDYLASAQKDDAKALIFFLPDTNTTDPPTANNAAWDLGDGGKWKSKNDYGVYAISASAAALLLNESALYSGNMTSVPYGRNLTEEYDPRDYVRLYMELNTASGSGLPSLWIFLLIIVAILLVIVAIVSLSMRYLQSRRREALRRRVAEGEIDLEALGIKRLTVPRAILDTMPIYLYTSPGTSLELRTDQVGTPARSLGHSTFSRNGKKPNSSATCLESEKPDTHGYSRSLFDQPTCAICLDDYVMEETEVRQLPCQHIFHPECVDSFLCDNSSLCPLCKKSVLPKGYCPTPITNAMVRRERLVRRLRPRPDFQHSAEVLPPQDSSSLSQRMRFYVRSRSSASPDMELGARGTVPSNATAVPSSQFTSQGQDGQDQSAVVPEDSVASNRRPQARREWARRRALALLGNRTAPLDESEASHATRPRWRKWLNGAFPRS